MKRFTILAIISLLVALPTEAGNKKYIRYAEELANSQMRHDPELWMSDGVKQPKWDYTQGLIAKAMLEVYEATGDTAYLRYVERFADYFIEKDGSIKTYKKSAYNLDRVNGGNFLFAMPDYGTDSRYRKAIDTLRSQLASQPRTTEGGFWHKKIYPWQMWLDGLYMAEPFYAHYASAYGEDSIWNDMVRQYTTVDKHTRKANGLNYHGWDESKSEQWANKETGCSAHSWGRAEGWYVMSIVDVLDYMPKEQAGRDSLIAILNRVCTALVPMQDKKTKMWYQVVDMPGEKGNYTESTCSAMFIYAMAKGARMGYLPKKYRKIAKTAFEGLWKNAITEEQDGTVDLERCCAVAGLGGKPYRSGSYEYYVNEKIRKNDPKGVGPLIMAAIELSK